jgi:hypothetical protein
VPPSGCSIAIPTSDHGDGLIRTQDGRIEISKIRVTRRWEEIDMRKLFVLLLAALVYSGTASAATLTWQAGWDNLMEPLNFTKSRVEYTVMAQKPAPSVVKFIFVLVGAKASKLYQVGFHLFCTTSPATFGRFPFGAGAGPCGVITKQGHSAGVAAVELGVVLTDIHGIGSVTVMTIAPSGTFNVEFTVRDGAGCNVNGGAGNGSDCAVDFQSPGPFGKTTAITVP